MNFEQALSFLKLGNRIARDGWNGKGMYLVYVTNCVMTFTDAQGYTTSASSPEGVKPFIAIRTADNALVPWVTSQTDVLAGDWVNLDS